MLTDGGIETRLIYEFHRPLPDFASFPPLFDPAGRAALAAIYRSYMKVAAEHDLPMQIGTPTWRAHPEGLARQGFAAAGDLARVNGEAVAFLQDVRDLGLLDKAFIAGVIGPQARRLRSAKGSADQRQRGKDIIRRRSACWPISASIFYTHRPSPAVSRSFWAVARACAAASLPYALAR